MQPSPPNLNAMNERRERNASIDQKTLKLRNVRFGVLGLRLNSRNWNSNAEKFNPRNLKPGMV